jgi:hypothetical protein
MNAFALSSASKGRRLALLAICALLVGSAAVQAAPVPLAPGGGVSTGGGNGQYSVPGTATLEATLSPTTITSSGGADSYTISEKVYKETNGETDFVVSVTVNKGFLDTTSLTGFGTGALDVFYTSANFNDGSSGSIRRSGNGNLTYVVGSELMAGATVTFGVQVDNVPGLTNSGTLKTNEFENGQTATANGLFVPTPEPSSLVIGSLLGLCGLGGEGFRRWFRKGSLATPQAAA